MCFVKAAYNFFSIIWLYSLTIPPLGTAARAFLEKSDHAKIGTPEDPLNSTALSSHLGEMPEWAEGVSFTYFFIPKYLALKNPNQGEKNANIKKMFTEASAS